MKGAVLKPIVGLGAAPFLFALVFLEVALPRGTCVLEGAVLKPIVGLGAAPFLFALVFMEVGLPRGRVKVSGSGIASRFQVSISQTGNISGEDRPC